MSELFRVPPHWQIRCQAALCVRHPNDRRSRQKRLGFGLRDPASPAVQAWSDTTLTLTLRSEGFSFFGLLFDFDADLGLHEQSLRKLGHVNRFGVAANNLSKLLSVLILWQDGVL